MEILLKSFADYLGECQSYRTEDGEEVEGILLDKNACKLLLRWWGKAKKPVSRGRPRSHPSLFGNPYKKEFDEEKQKIVASRTKSGKKLRGATKESIAILADRHGVEFDTMRKRIEGK